MNIRKFTALALTLALLALPGLSLGEMTLAGLLEGAMQAGRGVKTVVTFEAGPLLAQDESLAPMADLLRALRLEADVRTLESGTLVKGALFLQDQPSLDYTYLTDGDEIYLASNLLGQEALGFSMEEQRQVGLDQIQASLQELRETDPGTAMVMELYVDAYMALLKGEDLSAPFPSQELMLRKFWPAALVWYQGIVADPQVTDGPFESEQHDAAAKKTVYTVSAQQLSQLVSALSTFMSDDEFLIPLIEYVAARMPEIGDLAQMREEVRKIYTAMPEEFLKAVGPALPEPAAITIYTDGHGGVVAVEVSLRVVEDEESAFTLLAGYYLKTEGDGQAEQLALHMEQDEVVIAFTFSIKQAASGIQWNAGMGVSEQGQEYMSLGLDFSSGREAAGAALTESWRLGIAYNDGYAPMAITLDGVTTVAPKGADLLAQGRVDIRVTGLDDPIASLLYTAQTGEPTEIPNLAQGSLRPATMTEQEMMAWSQRLETNAAQVATQIIMNLPPSVLQMLMGGMMY